MQGIFNSRASSYEYMKELLTYEVENETSELLIWNILWTETTKLEKKVLLVKYKKLSAHELER